MSTRRRDQDEGSTKTRKKVEKPRKYKVLIHNDDYTTMEFVVFVLQQVFRLSPAAATRVMLHVHKRGLGVAGIYTREVAETRLGQVIKHARDSGHPLQCTMEPE